MNSARRTLPIRYAPYPGEALDSWLEAFAARLNCPFTDVLGALGLPNRDPAVAAPILPRWTTVATPNELAVITEVTGVAADVLTAMTLQPYDGHAVEIVPGQRRVHRQALWGRAGSRFCPACLEESGGRWQLTWRLGWSFACTRHHILLADRCPACLRTPRLRSHPRREVPRPGLCSSAALSGGPRPRRCHHPLTDTLVTALTPGGALEETQRLIDTALAAPDRMARWPLYGPSGVPLRTALRDLKSLGALVLNHATNADVHSVAPVEVLERLEQYRTHPLSARSQRHPDIRRSDVHSYFAPDDAAATAVATTAGLRILCAADIPAAADAARWLTERVAASGRPLYPAGVVSVGGTLSPVLEASLRCSRETQIMPVYRLRHRTAAHSTRSPANHDARADMLPSALWPEWTLRLSPRHPNGRPATKRTDELLSVACLLVGNTTSIQAAIRLTGTTVTSHNVSTLLADLTRRSDCADVLHALILLTDHLDQHGTPIDYARRRALFTNQARFIDPRCWSDLQRRLRSTGAPNVAHAQHWIFHTLTGSPPHLAHPDLTPAAGLIASSTSAPAGGSCLPKPNCSLTPLKRSSTSITSTNHSNGHPGSPPALCATSHSPAPIRAASPSPGCTRPCPAATSPSPRSRAAWAPPRPTSSGCCRSTPSTGAHPASAVPSTPLPAWGSGASGTNRTTCRSRTSPTAKEPASPPSGSPSSRTASGCALLVRIRVVRGESDGSVAADQLIPLGPLGGSPPLPRCDGGGHRVSACVCGGG
ncbi:TniQ family protein [Streptomyces sp. NPDC047014]|uniref:TniQ family protein n=1 Tax=Streptomyces sp. NPDC047014 TaxID=3155736 RepID=UPI00340E9D7B